jgi:hypothetical protein
MRFYPAAQGNAGKTAIAAKRDLQNPRDISYFNAVYTRLLDALAGRL